MAGRSKPAAAGPEVKTVEYLAPGKVPDLTHEPASIDAELEEIRDREAKANAVDISGSREEPTIDPALVEARDAEIKRLGGAPVKADANTAAAETKAPAKKAAARKSGN